MMHGNYFKFNLEKYLLGGTYGFINKKLNFSAINLSIITLLWNLNSVFMYFIILLCVFMYLVHLFLLNVWKWEILDKTLVLKG